MRLRVLASGVALLAVCITAATVVLVAINEHDGLPDSGPMWIAVFVVAAAIAPAGVGLLIALRRPGNRVAWLLLFGSLSFSLAIVTGALGQFLLHRSLPGGRYFLLLDGVDWPLLFAWPVVVTFVFPDGRLLSRGWRRVVGVTAFCFVGFMVAAAFATHPYPTAYKSVRSPLAGARVPAWLVWGIAMPLWLGILASLFAGAIAIRLRLRRSTGIERMQTLWLVWAAALIPLGLLLCVSWELAFSGGGDVVFVFLLVMQTAIALAIGIAVSRYRLYAIERLINRTAVYAVVTLVLVSVYVAVVLGLGVAMGRGSRWVTALATLAVALAFRPLRARVQAIVDRRFDRPRYEGVRHVRAFEEEVREGRRPPEEVGEVLARALRDPRATLLFWLPSSEAHADVNGRVVEVPHGGARATTEVQRDDVRVATLVHDPALRERGALLDSVIAAAMLSIEIARLRVEVRLQLAEVEASRARIVEAGYEERRRLERDLHDGAQQRLVSLGIRLRRLQRSLPPEARVLGPALDDAVSEVGSAIADLRQIAAGVRPARLDEGLAAALRDLARSAPVTVDVDAEIGRVPASVEAAAYFVACEALTNAVKYAAASRISVRAVRSDGSLLVTVADDGVGGATARRGSGLAGLEDRVAAHGGTLQLESPRGAGTTVEVRLPCES